MGEGRARRLLKRLQPVFVPEGGLPGSGDGETDAEAALPGEARVNEAARASLAGTRRGIRRFTPFIGPAVIAAVAYVDPGNFATNVSAGARFGFELIWVVLLANLIAMLIQTMSAKLGIATGRNLPELAREHFPRWVSWSLWGQAEIIAMATDLAEFVGAAVGLNLLFGIPLLPAGIITGVAAFAILHLTSRGFRALEIGIAVFVGVILAAFVVQVLLAHPSHGGVARGFVPHLHGHGALLIAAGIVGATVMPHVIYLHSALTQDRIVGRSSAERHQIFRFELVDVVIALSIAGIINIAMLVMAAAFFHGTHVHLDTLEDAYRALGSRVGRHANIVFGIALLASGLSSSSIGTLAGQVVMQGFVRRRIPLLARRVITMVPALIVLGVGVDPTRTLVISQVILSFGIPFALVPLLIFSSSRRIMGDLVNRPITTALSAAVVGLIIALNVFVIVQALG